MKKEAKSVNQRKPTTYNLAIPNEPITQEESSVMKKYGVMDITELPTQAQEAISKKLDKTSQKYKDAKAQSEIKDLFMRMRLYDKPKAQQAQVFEKFYDFKNLED